MSSFVAPQWPNLLKWYVAACVILAFVQLHAVLFSLARPFWQPSSTSLLYSLATWLSYGDTLVTCALGLLCVWGLHRRRDWARKTCLILFAVNCIAVASTFVDTFRSLSLSTETRDFVETSLVATKKLLSCAQATALIAFLVTGFRPVFIDPRAERCAADTPVEALSSEAGLAPADGPCARSHRVAVRPGRNKAAALRRPPAPPDNLGSGSSLSTRPHESLKSEQARLSC